MTATVRRQMGWDGFTCSAIFWALVSAGCDPTRHPLRRARRSDRAACRRNHSAGVPIIRSEDTRTSTWVFAEHLRPRHGLLCGRRPEDDLRKAPNAQRIYAGLVRTVRDHSAEQHSVESRGSDRAGDHHPIALRRLKLAPYPHRADDGAIQCGRAIWFLRLLGYNWSGAVIVEGRPPGG
jgi:hypothetical protein